MKTTGFAVAHTSMLLWALLVAASFSAAAQVSQAIDPVLLTGLRLLFCAAVFLPLLLVKGDVAMSLRGLPGHAVPGLLLALYWVLCFGPNFHRSPWTSATNMVDGWLAQQARQRQIIARANSYSAALKLITGTDYALTLPRRIQRLLTSADTFHCCEAPEGLPGFTLDMQWSQSADRDSANTWLREQLIRACAGQETT